jgi:predicted dehydrogenase
MTRRFSIGIVGTGGIAEIHAQGINRLAARAEIVSAVDTDHGRLDAFAAKWNVARTFGSVDELIAAGNPPDLVVLCTPPSVHAAQAELCLKNGLTVLCEKPATLSLAEFDALAAAEEASSGRFASVVQHRFGGKAVLLRSLVGDDRLGSVMTAVCHTLWYRPDSYFAVPWRGSFEAEGGGPTLGHGIHQMDLLLSILGPWKDVVAVADRRDRATQTEDVSAAIVTLENGATVSVVNSLLSPRETTYLRFDFAHATVELEHLYGYGDDDWRVTALPGHESAISSIWDTGPGNPSGHAAQYAAIFDAIDAGEPPPVTLAAGRPTMELVTAIYASAFTGRRVTAGEIGPGSPFYDRLDGGAAPWLQAH